MSLKLRALINFVMQKMCSLLSSFTILITSAKLQTFQCYSSYYYIVSYDICMHMNTIKRYIAVDVRDELCLRNAGHHRRGGRAQIAIGVY